MTCLKFNRDFRNRYAMKSFADRMGCGKKFLSGRAKLPLASLFLAVVAVTLLLAPMGQPWADADYTKKMSFNITNRSALGDNVVPMNITFDSDMQADFDDLRFYAEDDTTALSYWLEDKVNSDWAYVWVRVEGHQNGYVYYGNSSVSSGSSGKATFYLFDHYTEANATIWDEGSGVGYVNSYVEVEGNNAWGTYYLDSDEEFGLSTRIRFKGVINNKTAAEGVTHSRIGFDNHDGAGSENYTMFKTADDDQTTGINYDGTNSETADFGVQTAERTYEIQRVNTSHTGYFADGVEKVLTTYCPPDSIAIGIEAYYGYARTDWLWMHNFTDAFQSVSFGSEESPADATPPTMTTQNPVNETDETGSVIDINITVNEDADWCAYNLGGGTNYTMLNDSMTNWFQVNQSVITNGTTVNLQIYCNDTTGNMGYNGSLWFTYANQEDVTAPTMTLPNPENTSHTSLPIDINITVSEDADWCSWNLDGGDNTTASNSSLTNWYSQTNSSLVDGHTYQLNVYCNDTTGNMGLNSTVWFTYDSTVPSADFVTPTLGNASYTSSADYIEVNVSSDETLSECILQIDYINYSMACTGQYCYLNLTNLGDSGIADEPSIWAKYSGNVVIPHPVAEPDGFYLNGTFHLVWREGYTPTGFARGNSSDGFPTYTSESGAFLPNATADENMIAMPYLYYCARPECEHDYYIFYPAKNNSGDSDLGRIKVMWTDNLYDTQGAWYRCSTDLVTVTATNWRSNILANVAPHFNGTGWKMLVEGHNGSLFQIGAFSKDQVNPCVAFDVLNNDLPVMAAGDWSGSEQGTGNPWLTMAGDRYITYTGGKSSGKWKTYSLNSTDFITWTMRETDPIIDTTSYYDDVQTADPVFIIATGQTNDSFIYYGAINQTGSNIAIAAATTNYTVNDIWGAGIQTIGELEFTVHVKDSAGNWNSSSRTLNFGTEDTTPPTLAFTSPTQPNGTDNDTAWFYVNITSTENLSTCLLNVYPEVDPNQIHYTQITYASDAYEIAYNGSIYGYDAEHAEAGTTGTNKERVVFYYNLSTVTSNVTNASWSFTFDNHSVTPELTDITVNFYYHTGYDAWNQSLYSPDYCYSNKNVCWNYTENSTSMGKSYTIPIGVFPYFYRVETDVTTIINDQLEINGGHGGIMLSMRSDDSNRTGVGIFNENNNYSEMDWLNHTMYAYENVTMTVVNGSGSTYCQYNASLDLLPPNSTEYYFMVYGDDSEGNMGVTEARAWTYSLQDSTAPTITVQSPLNQSYSSEPINFNITVSESAANCTWAISGTGDNHSMSNDSMTNWFYASTGNAETTMNLWVYCEDLVGLWGLNNTIWFTYAPSGATTCESCADCSSYIQNSSAGDTITLAADITDATSTCIDFGGNDGITFDCDGHTLASSNGIGDAIKIYGVNDSVIQGCSNISYFHNAIHSITPNQSGNFTIYNISIHDTDGTGIVISGQENNLTDITIEGSGTNGITMADNGNELDNVNSSYSSGYGIYLLMSSYNTLNDVTSIGHSDHNLFLSASNYNVINGSSFSSEASGKYNILSASSANNYTNNTLTGTNGFYLTGIDSWLLNNDINCSLNHIAASNYLNETQSTQTNILGYAGSGGNYWNNYTGSDADADGIGDTAYSDLGSTDSLPLIDPTYTFDSVAVNSTGYANHTFSTVAADEELLEVTAYLTGNTPDIMTIATAEDLANTTLVTVNTSTFTATPATYTDQTVNITIAAACPAGSYEGNLTFTGGNSTTTLNITVSFTISAQAGDVNITQTSWSAAKAQSATTTVTLTTSNEGDYNLTHCNWSFSNTLSATASYSQSDFTVQNTTNVDTTITIGGGSTGTDSSATFTLTCQATASGGEDSEIVSGSISITADPTGGGGGGGYVPSWCGNFTMWPDTYMSGYNREGHNISWWLRIDNGETSQRFLFSFSNEVEDLCEVYYIPDEQTPANGFLQVNVVCRAPGEEINGHLIIKTDTGCEKSIAIMIGPGDIITEFADGAFKAITGSPMDEASPIHWVWFVAFFLIIISFVVWWLKS